MQVIINGDRREFEGSLTVGGLLEQLGLGGKPVVVEHNQVALLPRELTGATINDGDLIEIVQITAGG